MKARPILKEVMARHSIGPKDFFGPSRLPHTVGARRAASVELRKAGLSKRAIGRLINRDEKTVAYYLKTAEQP